MLTHLLCHHCIVFPLPAARCWNSPALPVLPLQSSLVFCTRSYKSWVYPKKAPQRSEHHPLPTGFSGNNNEYHANFISVSLMIFLGKGDLFHRGISPESRLPTPFICLTYTWVCAAPGKFSFLRKNPNFYVSGFSLLIPRLTLEFYSLSLFSSKMSSKQ